MKSLIWHLHGIESYLDISDNKKMPWRFYNKTIKDFLQTNPFRSKTRPQAPRVPLVVIKVLEFTFTPVHCPFGFSKQKILYKVVAHRQLCIEILILAILPFICARVIRCHQWASAKKLNKTWGRPLSALLCSNIIFHMFTNTKIKILLEWLSCHIR